MFLKDYLSDIFKAVGSLARGMKTTGSYFIRPSEIITQQYPDNRDTLSLPPRFRGEVVMPHDEHNEHACTGCTRRTAPDLRAARVGRGPQGSPRMKRSGHTRDNRASYPCPMAPSWVR